MNERTHSERLPYEPPAVESDEPITATVLQCGVDLGSEEQGCGLPQS